MLLISSAGVKPRMVTAKAVNCRDRKKISTCLGLEKLAGSEE